tara:strand:- start:680 stop:1837 length:1158 start_codon:yes stop_codon:yes gene_type:complete
MATETVINRPAPFVEDIGTKLSEQALALQDVPVVTTSASGLTKAPGETDAGFLARQQAAQAFDVRKQNLAGIAPQVAGQDALQQRAQSLAQQGIGSYQPFLQQAQTQSQLASGLGTIALGGLGAAGQELTGAGTALGTAGTTFGGVGTGAQAFQQDVSQFMSPYQSQVIDASLAEFDRNKAIQEKSIADQALASGAFGGGREGVQRAEFQTGAARERALLQAGLLQQGFGQAQQARQQDIQNRFNLGQAQAGLAGQQAGFAGQRAGLATAAQGLGQFRSGLAGQQAQFGQGLQQLQGTDVSRLGQLGALNQAQQQAEMDAQREATRMAAFQPQEELNRFADITTGIMGGMRGSGTTTSNVPNPSPLQSALGIGSTIAGIYGAFNK